MIWKSSDRETRVKPCLQHLSEGVSHSIEEKSLSSVSELDKYSNKYLIIQLFKHPWTLVYTPTDSVHTLKG